MIQQPELGKKISDCRKAKGLTQEELVDKCNLSVRTLQRIEAGEVTPRSYTLRMIFDVLELDFNNPLNSENDRGLPKVRPGQFYINIIDLFNLKTNTMKKISILSVIAFAIVIVITSLTGNLFAQSDSRVKKQIEKSNSDFMEWFNKGDIVSLAGLYREDACLISRGCGKEYIRNYYQNESGKYKFTELTISSVSVSDSIAVEKGKWSAVLSTGETFGGEYLSEWRLTGNKWLIVSESSGLSME